MFRHYFRQEGLSRRLIYLILSLLLGLQLFTYLIYPNLTLIWQTFSPNGHIDLSVLGKVISSQRVLGAMKNTFLLAISLCVTVNILGIFQVLCLDYFKIPGRRFLALAFHAPLVSNRLVLVTAYNFLLGSQGLVTSALHRYFPGLDPYWFRGFWPVLLVMTFAGTNNHILFVRDALRSIDYQTVEAAQNMGVRGFRILWKVLLPTLRPAIFAVSILTFINGISAFAESEILGAAQFETINPLVRAFSATLNTRNYAAVLAIFLGFISILVLVIANRIEARRKYNSVSKVKTKLQRQEIKSRPLRYTLTFLAHLSAWIQLIPLAFILLFSFMPRRALYEGRLRFDLLNLDNYRRALSSAAGLKPLLTSIVYSALASLLVLFLILILARVITKHKTRWTAGLELILQVPWFLPSTLLALGLVMTFSRPSILTFGLTLGGSIWLLLIGYVVGKIPYTLRMIKAAYVSIDNSLEEAARNLGAGVLHSYCRVILPIITPAMLSMFLLNFISRLAEYSMAVFLFHPLYRPLGVVLSAANSSDADPQTQMLTFVYAAIVMLLSILIVGLVYGRKYRQKRRGS